MGCGTIGADIYKIYMPVLPSCSTLVEPPVRLYDLKYVIAGLLLSAVPFVLYRAIDQAINKTHLGYIQKVLSDFI